MERADLARAVVKAIRAPLDILIETFAPSWGLKRGLARYHLGQLRHDLGLSGVNEQASRSHRRRTLTVDEDVRANRAHDLRVARDLYARNSWAVGAVNSITGNVIGRGMSLESAIVKKSGEKRGELDTRQNDLVEEVFNKWAERADVTGTRSFMSIQREAYRERWISNDVFIRRHRKPDRRVPLALEVVGGELLSDQDNGSNIKQGIEFNALGEPAFYHFFRSEEDTTTERIAASEVIHIFRPHRPGAVRGLSPMSPVASSFEALARYLNHELTRAGIASAFVFLHKTGGANIAGLETGDPSDRTDPHGNPVVNIVDGGGIMLRGGPNDALESAAPAIQSTAFDPFVRLVLRSIATALGISYELMARDFTQTNFSSSRSAHLEDRRQWEPEQQEFENDALRRIWNWFTEDARMAGVFPFASREVFPVVWIPQGWNWIDPVKEVDAKDREIGIGLDNRIDAARRLGRDFEDNMRKEGRALEVAKENGVTLTTGMTTNGNSETEPPEEEGAEEGGGTAPRAIAG